ncbi:MAG: TRIC cation channel family protein [Terriglobales bacterium]
MTEIAKRPSNTLLFAADMAGTLIFGIEGAEAAITGNLDLLGLMVLAFSTALAGGIFRDILIGAIPPSSLRDWRYSAMAFTGAAIVFFSYRFLQGIPSEVILVLDAAGLALFAVAGTEKALLYEMHPFIAILMGTITGVGGGTVRDIFLARVPNVLRSDIYATAAMAGAAVMIAARKLKISHTWAAVLGGVFCFALRMVSVWRHWNLPKVMMP